MVDTVFWFFGGVGAAALVAWLANRLFRRADSAGTERTLRGRMRGPFVPLSEVQLRMVEERQREQEQVRQSMKSIAPLARETLAESALRSGGLR